MRHVLKEWTLIAAALAAVFAPAASGAEALAGKALVQALRGGGYVLLMRHAKSPRDLPDAQAAQPGNEKLERQLDETGRETATQMGRALKTLGIPIGEVVSSPTYRALETARYAGFATVQTAAELGDSGRSMQPNLPGAATQWLRARLAMQPKAGTNTVLITHQPNIAAALGDAGSNLRDGEALIIRPGSTQTPNVVARVKIEEWPELSTR